MDTPLGSGFPTDTHTIRVNDYEVEIKQNLYDLLGELVRESQGKLWWIDALCINQNDEVEKPDQVERMSETYHGANNVLVWLGIAYPSMPRVVFIMEQLYQNYGDHMDEINDLRDPQQLQLLGLQTTTADDWYEFICFMKRSWFSRTWTAQEFALAKSRDFRCGPVNLDTAMIITVSMWTWNTMLIHVLTSIWRHFRPGKNFAGVSVAGISKNISLLASVAKAEGRKAPDAWCSGYANLWYNTAPTHLSMPAFFRLLLRETASLECSDPRDKIFSVLGLAKALLASGEISSPSIQINYTVSIADLYTNTMSYLFDNLGLLTILSCSQRYGEGSIPDLPSWVEDFSNNTALDAILDHDYRHSTHPRTFKASRQCKLGFSIRDRSLVVHHLTYATVMAVSETWGEMARSKSFQSAFRLLLLQYHTHGIERPSVDDLWQTMLLDSMFNYHTKFTADEIRLGFRETILLVNLSKLREIVSASNTQDVTINSTMHYQFLLASLDATSTIPSPKEAVLLRSELDSQNRFFRPTSLGFQRIVNESMLDRRLVLLNDGQLGLATYRTRPGDKICIIADGVKTPMVLRKAGTSNEDMWLLIGEAYVKSIMFGEAVDQMEVQGKTWQQICIV